jgi:16S rRNA (cytidine1402-2'-O)-methyltransferase
MASIYLIPALLSEEGLKAIPPYIVDAIKDCQVFFAENERTTRRYFKQLWREMVIDEYEWYTIGDDTVSAFKQKLKEGKSIGIISEAGCPGIADPGQALISIAQDAGVTVKPLVGPSSILLALMASGMNGQQFRFAGYLPIDNQERIKAIKELEAESVRKKCTQIFIETPYRNNALIEALLKTCSTQTRLCIAVDITGPGEWIRTLPVADWQKNKPDIHKRPAIFLLYAGH